MRFAELVHEFVYQAGDKKPPPRVSETCEAVFPTAASVHDARSVRTNVTKFALQALLPDETMALDLVLDNKSDAEWMMTLESHGLSQDEWSSLGTKCCQVLTSADAKHLRESSLQALARAPKVKPEKTLKNEHSDQPAPPATPKETYLYTNECLSASMPEWGFVFRGRLARQCIAGIHL